MLVEYELELIRERTNAGLAAARARGTRLGRPPVTDDDKVTAAVAMAGDGLSQRSIAKALGVSKGTINRTLREHRQVPEDLEQAVSNDDKVPKEA